MTKFWLLGMLIWNQALNKFQHGSKRKRGYKSINAEKCLKTTIVSKFWEIKIEHIKTWIKSKSNDLCHWMTALSYIQILSTKISFPCIETLSIDLGSKHYRPFDLDIFSRSNNSSFLTWYDVRVYLLPGSGSPLASRKHPLATKAINLFHHFSTPSPHTSSLFYSPASQRARKATHHLLLL